LIKVGVGACTVGKPVRYNGEAKRSHEFLEKLGEHVCLMPFCPEVGIGLGVPRETIRLVDSGDSADGPRAMDSNTHTKDYTAQLEAFATHTMIDHPDLAGYILVKGSPSCGLGRIKVYQQEGHLQNSHGIGIFARRIQELNPLLPVEEDGRLFDPGLRESFVSRLYVYQDWLDTVAAGLSAEVLIKFYGRYKYMLMAHHVPSYKALGKVLANAGKRNIEQLGLEMMNLMMLALKKPANRKGFTNALQHIRGYLKRDLATDEKRDVDHAIEHYRTGVVPLVVPMRLLQYQFNRHPNDYIGSQMIMQPYPEELGLQNEI
jgi:uncharacterized protein YbgA (DUF1722 family)/uncharacterized protein YbbK (DUF523 family)